jgi:EmrB/QacA subfamily drug resistance transporter
MDVTLGHDDHTDQFTYYTARCSLICMTASIASDRAAEPVSQRSLTLITVVLVLGAITTILDTTIVNIALDRLREHFDASLADTQWVVTAYLLAYVAVVPASGWASERFGTRRVWIGAVATFMIGSMLCGFSWSLGSLIVFRVLQGMGGGLVLPVTITILTRAAGRARLGRAIATIGFIAQLGPILGPLTGGLILDSVSWSWLFFVNVPICLVAVALAPRILPAGTRDSGQSLDGLGLALLTPGVVAVAYGINRAVGPGGFGATATWLPLALGVVLLACFAAHSLTAKRATLLDVRLFARRSFGLSSVIVFVSGFSLYALMFMLPLFYQQVRGESVLATGVLLIPQGIGTMLFIVLNRRLERVDTRLVIAAGVVITVAGVLPFALANATGGGAILIVGQLLQGFGMGAVSLPVMTVAFAGLSHAETPRGSAAFSVVKQIGAPFGVTVIAVILQHQLSGAATPEAALDAFRTTFWWALGLTVIPLLLAAFLPASQSADEEVVAVDAA